jgi:hypothetical protein
MAPRPSGRACTTAARRSACREPDAPREDGTSFQEDGQLACPSLSHDRARLRTTVEVDSTFALRRFSFSLDPGPTHRRGGDLEGRRLRLEVKTPRARSETRDLRGAGPGPQPVAPPGGGRPRRGRRLEVTVFDPRRCATPPCPSWSRGREVVGAAGRPTSGFRVETSFAGVSSTSWITDLGGREGRERHGPVVA